MKISKINVAWSGLEEELVGLLEQWHPPAMETELEYRDALFAHLRDALPDDAQVEKEYRHGGTTVDVYLQWKGLLGSMEDVFFELKHNLSKKAQLDRVGQIQRLARLSCNVVIVLTGKRDSALVGRLRDQYAEFLRDCGQPWEHDSWMVVVEIP